mmetsp:Transcript_69980/g.198333  ORF Transcript_69980/g.198333 Transcript_69980/m.198333 type:complete len:217 (-) Transcript_69980:557-1207(-)
MGLPSASPLVLGDGRIWRAGRIRGPKGGKSGTSPFCLSTASCPWPADRSFSSAGVQGCSSSASSTSCSNRRGSLCRTGRARRTSPARCSHHCSRDTMLSSTALPSDNIRGGTSTFRARHKASVSFLRSELSLASDNVFSATPFSLRVLEDLSNARWASCVLTPHRLPSLIAYSRRATSSSLRASRSKTCPINAAVSWRSVSARTRLSRSIVPRCRR